MTPGLEQRREARRSATGRVRIKFSDPQLHEVAGKLVDVSAGGFRMKHECSFLQSGQIVEFRHVEASGKAQVVWNRILAEGVETGFLVIAGPNYGSAGPSGSTNTRRSGPSSRR